MSDYNSKIKTGGRINSKIDNQDSIAAIYSVELLSNYDIFKFNISINDYCIICEGNDDIEIMNNDYHVFIQVKSATLSPEDFKKTVKSFLANDSIESQKESFFVISAFEPIKYNGKNFTDRLLDYKNVLNNQYESETRKKEIKLSLIEDFDLSKYESIIDRLHIDKRPLFRDIEDTRAIFARYLRLAYGFKDHEETRIDFLFTILCDKFSELRRNRDNIDKTKIEEILGNELCKSSWYSGLSLTLGYTKLEDGYIKDTKLSAKRQAIVFGARRAYKKIMHDWRKAYIKESLFSMFLGAKRCPKCGHPMIANICGLNGIACPDCGYNPYVTMVLHCECGDYEVIKTQPDINDDSVFNYLNEFFRNRKDTSCKKCGKELLDTYVEMRTILLPIPIPFKEYKNIDVIYKNSKY